MKIEIDRSLCDGNGNCVAEAPKLLELDASDEPQILAQPASDEDIAAAKRAANSCPKAALLLISE